MNRTLTNLAVLTALVLTGCGGESVAAPAPSPVTVTETATLTASPTPIRSPARSIRTSTPTPTPSPTETYDPEQSEGIIPPRFEVADIQQQDSGVYITVTVERELGDGQTGAITRRVQGLAEVDDGYFVTVDCASTGARLGNARFAVGALGEARTGLPAGEYESAPVEGATCP